MDIVSLRRHFNHVLYCLVASNCPDTLSLIPFILVSGHPTTNIGNNYLLIHGIQLKQTGFIIKR